MLNSLNFFFHKNSNSETSTLRFAFAFRSSFLFLSAGVLFVCYVFCFFLLCFASQLQKEDSKWEDKVFPWDQMVADINSDTSSTWMAALPSSPMFKTLTMQKARQLCGVLRYFVFFSL